MNEMKKLWLSVATVSAAGLAVAALAGAGILASQRDGAPGAAGTPGSAATDTAVSASPSSRASEAAHPEVSAAATATVLGEAAGGTSPNPTAPATAGPLGAQAGPTRPLTELVDSKWLQLTAQATGVPERALAAYAGAAIYLEQTQPSCRLGWNTLAAIGQVESEHGSLNGAKLSQSGEVKPGIRGVQLRGQEVAGQSLARIPDTDSGRVDGDQEWDRAVGPMQFLPGTWASYASDGNADGTASPDQIDDAALAAARYLCSAGRDLTVAENWIAAVKSYNDSAEYNNRVADAAQQLADKSPRVG